MTLRRTADDIDVTWVQALSRSEQNHFEFFEWNPSILLFTYSCSLPREFFKTL